MGPYERLEISINGSGTSVSLFVENLGTLLNFTPQGNSVESREILGASE